MFALAGETFLLLHSWTHDACVLEGKFMNQFYGTKRIKHFPSLFLSFAATKSTSNWRTSLFLFDGDKIRFILNMICVQMANLGKAVENG